MKYESVLLKDITINLDNKRKPLNKEERNKKKSKELYPYCGANGVLDYINDYIFDEEILCVAEDGGRWGLNEKCSYLMNEPCWVNNHTHVLKPAPNINIKYLYYFLNRADLNKYITGTTRGKLNKSALESIEINLPTKEVQDKIVNILDKCQSIIENRKTQITELFSLKQSVFLEMFGDPVKNSKGWDKVNLGTVIDVLTDYHSNGSYETLKKNVELLDTPNFALMVRTTDLESKNFSNGVKYISESAYEYLKKSKVFGGEIIINKIGSAGKVYLMPELGKPVSLGMNAFMIRTNNLVENIFIYHQLISKSITLEIQKKVQGAVTKTITKEAVRSIEVVLPPKHIQTDFLLKIRKVELLLELTNKSLIELENNYNSIMNLAFKGELFDDEIVLT